MVYESVVAEKPEAYAKTLRAALVDAGFQVSPIEKDGEHFLLSLRATGEVTEKMQEVLATYDLVLDSQGELSLRIGR